MISTMLVNALEEFGSQNDWLPNDVAFMGVVGVCAGILFSLWMCDRHGRKTALQLANSIYLVGMVIMCVSISHNEIVAGRIISSLGLGVLSVTPPIYITNICTTVIHGRQIAVNCVLIAIGHLFLALVSLMLTKVRTYHFCFFFFFFFYLFIINTYFVISGKSPMALDACHRCCSNPKPIFYVDSMSKDTKVADYNGKLSTCLCKEVFLFYVCVVNTKH
jgi:MFS family permease